MLHYMTVTDRWQSGGRIGTQRAEDAEHLQRGAQHKSQGGTGWAYGVWKPGSLKKNKTKPACREDGCTQWLWFQKKGEGVTTELGVQRNDKEWDTEGGG